METNSKMILDRIFRLDPGSDLTQKQRTELFRAMSPRSLVEAYFDTDFMDLRDKYAAIHMESLKETFLLLEDNTKLLEQVAEVISVQLKDNRSELCKDEIESDLLRFVPILLECPAFDRTDVEWGDCIIREMAETLLFMREAAKMNFNVLVRWWDKDPDLLARVVKVYGNAFWNLLKRCHYNNQLMPRDSQYLAVLIVLKQVNESLGYKVPAKQFYILQSGDEANQRIRNLLLQFHQQQLQFSILRHFNKTIAEIALTFEATFGSGSSHMLEIILPKLHLMPAHLQFEIDNDIEKVVESAISKVQGKRETALLLPFEVYFKDNVSLGVNAGGPMKEFFFRLFGELFNVQKHHIFKKLTDSPSCTTLWLNKDCKDMDKLRSVGKLFALMFYNKVIVTMPFPLLFYKKLLGKSRSSFEDLMLLDPGMAKSLEALLDMSDDELGDFNFTVDGPVDEPVIELRPRGKDQIVTTDNVREYIELYAKHYTATSQFDVFSECFRNMFRPHALHQIFTPQELMSLFQGGDYDWNAFQQSFRYEKGYTSEHRVIKMFWSVFHGDLTEDERRDFLRVMTGADHVPIGGFREIGPRMWPMGVEGDCRGKPPKDMCPEVNTCHGFIVLHLPMYSERRHLKERLIKLLESKGQGFYKPVK